MIRKHIILTLACLFSGFLLPAQSGDKSAETIIRENSAAFSLNLVAGDIDAIVEAYTDDAKIFPNGSDILRGSEAIRRYWTPGSDRKGKTVYHHITQEEIAVTGSEAYDWGYYEGRTRNEDGTETPWKGKYVIVWKETAPAEWKIYLDIWNRVPNE